MHTVIPRAPSIANSLGVFLGSAGYSLASFAGVLSDGRRSISLAWEKRLDTRILHVHSRQATLHPTPFCTYWQAGTACRLPPSRRTNHALGPPRKRGLRPHAIADRPTTLTPCTSPQLGVESQHKGLHRCALSGLLAPPSGVPAPTRILRHLSTATFIIPYVSSAVQITRAAASARQRPCPAERP